MANNPNTLYFQNFLAGWLVRQQNYLNQLLSSQNHEQVEVQVATLVREVISHYSVYYQAKSEVVRENVFILFNPPWLSTLERTFLWVAGFKPGVLFSVLEKSVGTELTAQQVEDVKSLRVRKVKMEKILNDEMIEIQESMAGPSWVMLLRTTRTQEVLDAEVDRAIGTIRDRLKELVLNADSLRTSTATELVEILTPAQAVRFLTAIAKLQLKIRALGQRKDAERMDG